MSEPPVHTRADDVHAEPRKTGHRFLDLTIAFSAILISLISLGVAVHHGHVQQRLVAANSWPFLRFDFDNSRLAGGGQSVTYSIINSGVGPAVLKSFIVEYEGKRMHGFVELLQACCGMSRDMDINGLLTVGFLGESRPVGVIRASDRVTLFRFFRTPENVALLDGIAAARDRVKFRACYCSIVGECWVSDLRSLDPQPVAACKASPDDYVEFGAGLDQYDRLPELK
ncbi:MAG TPA: hypothetical protein VFS52_15850 [Steroidobacteraceae bacterium]|jgi:hypothetical protein|nr:hypothetical protein [Steroidobacteraceae bacterium]